MHNEHNPIVTLENPAQTARDIMEDLGKHEAITPAPNTVDHTKAHLVTVPRGRKVEDLTEMHRKAATYLKPARRTGTAKLHSLQSLIDWSIRFKGDTSALYALPEMDSPSITCIADYHGEGPADAESKDGDPNARYCDHRAVYEFPLSNEWKAWMAVSGQALNKDQLGAFIEEQALDVMDPTPAMLKGDIEAAREPWEKRLIETATRLQGRHAQLSDLLEISKQFAINETSNLSVKTDRDTGEQAIQFVNEHQAPDGKPITIPNLITIAIPVFLNGAPYRMSVRFRYRKNGANISFFLEIHNSEKVFEAAFEEATQQAQEDTGLPLFLGSPES